MDLDPDGINPTPLYNQTQIGTTIAWLNLLSPLFWKCLTPKRSTFKLPQTDHDTNVDAAEQAVLDGTSKWSCKIACTGKSSWQKCEIGQVLDKTIDNLPRITLEREVDSFVVMFIKKLLFSLWTTFVEDHFIVNSIPRVLLYSK